MSSAKSVVISCAGIGSRLGLGQTKALLNINGRSLIQWQLELFRKVEDVRIVIGYQAREIVEEVLRFRSDVIFVYNHNYFDTKTGASFFLGSQQANEYVIEWDGDLIVHPDDVQKILNKQGEFICYSDIASDEAVFIRTNEQGDVLSFSREGGNVEWTGPACIKRQNLTYTPGNVYEQFQDHLPMEGLKITAYDIDTYEDYKRVSEFVKTW